MKTATLHRLAGHLLSALLLSEPTRQARERCGVRRIKAALYAIRIELAARATRVHRVPEELHNAERNIQRLLADFLELGNGGAERAHRDAQARVDTALKAAALRAVTPDGTRVYPRMRSIHPGRLAEIRNITNTEHNNHARGSTHAVGHDGGNQRSPALAQRGCTRRGRPDAQS